MMIQGGATLGRSQGGREHSLERVHVKMVNTAEPYLFKKWRWREGSRGQQSLLLGGVLVFYSPLADP